MRVDRLEEIATWLEAGAPHRGQVTGFDIHGGIVYKTVRGDDVSPTCGTVCCIGGAAVAFFAEELADAETLEATLARAKENGRAELPWYDVQAKATEILELEHGVAYDLFNPTIPWDLADSKVAARVVRNLIATGEVDWEI